jgi:hypothetical protein
VLTSGDWYRKRRACDERVSGLLLEGQGLDSVVLVNKTWSDSSASRCKVAALRSPGIEAVGVRGVITQKCELRDAGEAHAGRQAHLGLLYSTNTLPLTGSASLHQVLANAHVQLPLEELLVNVAAWAGLRGGELAALVSAQAEVRVSVAEATRRLGGRLSRAGRERC